LQEFTYKHTFTNTTTALSFNFLII